MKKLLGLIVVGLILFGCAERKADGSVLLKERDITIADNPYIEVIDSCEYVIWGTSMMAHKGNCKFCAARRDIVPGPPVNIQEPVDGEYHGKNEKY